MLRLISLTGKEFPLTEYKNLSIESTLSYGDKSLSFDIPFEVGKDIKEECYIRTETDEYVIKELGKNGEEIKVKAKLNIEELDGKLLERFDSTEHTLSECMNLALVGTGWTVVSSNMKKRNIAMTDCYVWDIVKQVIKTYAVELKIDSINKVLKFADRIGEDKGAYFSDQLNLISLDVSSDTHEYFTRIVPVGKDGLTIEEVNDGKNYVENYQYSNKVRTYRWKDERYTSSEYLKEDAILKLADMSKPYKAYSCAIVDLAKSGDYDVLEFSIGDTVTVIDSRTGIREKQRIVKLTEYPEDYAKNSCELANTVMTFEEMASAYEDTVATVDNITVDNGTVDGSTVDGIYTEQIYDFDSAVINNATIVKLEANYVTISGELTAVHATIGEIESSMITANYLEANFAQINLANVEAGSIGTALISDAAIGTTQIADGSITDAKIVGLSANKITAGTIDAELIEVINLHAANITVGTINGAQIATGAIDMTNLSTELNYAITTAQSDAETALNTANGKNKIFYQTTPPAGMEYTVNDLWFDTDDGNRIYTWNGSTWAATQFGTGAIAEGAITADEIAAEVNTAISTAQSNASTALTNASTAQATADGKNTVYYATTAPTGGTYKLNDVWFNTDDGYKMYRWNGSAWIAGAFGSNAIANGAVGDTQLNSSVTDTINNAFNNANTALDNINNLEIGGTNLIRGTRDFVLDLNQANGWFNRNNEGTFIVDDQGFTIWNKSAIGNTSNVFYSLYSSFCPVQAGDKLLAHFWLKVASVSEWDIKAPCILGLYDVNNVRVAWIDVYRYYEITNQPTVVDGEWTHFVINVNVQQSGWTWISGKDIADVAKFNLRLVLARNGDISFKKAKVELGNKATDWTPAPEDVQSQIATAQATADGKNTVYYATTAPTGGTYKLNDVWFDTDAGNQIYRWSGSAWVATQFGTNALANDIITADKLADSINTAISTAKDTADTAMLNAATAQTAANNANTAANNAQMAADEAAADALEAAGIANGKGKVIIQSTAPAAADRLAQNLWIDTTGGANTPKRWNGSAWVAVTDKAATDAANAAATAQTTAGNAATAAAAAQTAANNAQTTANTAVANASTAQTTADGKNTVFYQMSAPSTTGRKTGDVWFDTDDGNRMYRWSGSAWTATQFGTNAIAALSITNALIANGTIQDAKIGNLDAGKLTAGYLSADRIQAGTLTANKLVAGTITAQSGVIANGAILNAMIANATIGTAKIADLAVTGAKIANATIDNANIKDATIQSAKIYALDAAKITTGMLDANRIAANSITTNKILIGDFENLAVDSSFENTTVMSGVYVTSLEQIHSGTKSMKLIAGATGYASYYLNPSRITVKAGEKIYVEWWAYRNSASVPARVNIQINNYDGTFTYDIASVYSTDSPSANVTNQTWIRYSYVGTVAKDGTAIVQLKLNSATAMTGDWYFDDIIIRRMSTGELIVDGAITAEKVAAGAITTDKLTVGIGENGDLFKNGNFTSWSGTYPDGTLSWSDSEAPTKVAVDGSNVIQCTAATATTNSGVTIRGTSAGNNNTDSLSAFPLGLNLEGMQYIYLECKFRLTSGTNPNGAALLIDIYRMNSTYDRLNLPMNLAGTSLNTNTWYTVRRVFAIPKYQLTYRSVNGYLLGNYNDAPVGNGAAKTIQFMSISMKRATYQDYLTQAWTTNTTQINGGSIAANTITATQIAGNTITAAKMAAGTITAASGILANAVIVTAKIADLAVTGTKIANATIGTAKIADLAVTGAKIANATIDNAKISNLNAGKITAGTLSVSRLEIVGTTNSIVFALNNAGSLSSTITTSLNGDIMTPRTITADKIVVGAITANEIAGNTITGNKIAANAITATHINVSTLSAITANLGTVTAGTLTGLTMQTGTSGARLVISDDDNNSFIKFYPIDKDTSYFSTPYSYVQGYSTSAACGISMTGPFGSKGSPWIVCATLKNDNKTFVNAYASGSISIGGNTETLGLSADLIDIGKLDGSGDIQISGHTTVGTLTCSGNGIELYHYTSSGASGTPFIDFHYGNTASDYNIRIINSASGVLNIQGGEVYTNGNKYVHGHNTVLTFHRVNDSYMQVQTNAGNYGVNWWLSDKRLKENITIAQVRAMEVINQIQHREFSWKSDSEVFPGQHESLGYVAQELEQLDEKLVLKIPQYADNNDLNSEILEYNYQINETKLIPYITKGMQELSGEVDILKQQLAEAYVIIQNLQNSGTS